jgi:hypothetical protein
MIISLATLPERMKSLPIDERGYPIPWFVDWLDGKPEFRAMDPRKFVGAINHRLCWVCGQQLGVHVCFVAGPMCGINRTSSEPPSHAQCALWSAQNCPFLANPRMVRREDELGDQIRGNVAGISFRRNSGVVMLWRTRTYDVFPDGKGGRLLYMGEPERVEWYAEGRSATRAEVMASIESGLPALEALARLEKGGLEHLERCTRRFEKYLPTVDAPQDGR